MTSIHDTGNISVRKRLKSCARNTFSVKTLKKKLPIIVWLSKYSFDTLIQDIIAGITVGLTAIPQGIAYAIVAGLSPEYGLYSGLMGGFIYTIFGSCKDVTIGPTAIMSAMIAKYVSRFSSEFAVIAAFLVGVVELTMGILRLGFLVEFISVPVISGFTTAAALQIASAQLKSLFGLDGNSGHFFAESIYSFILNINTAQLWDSLLGFSAIAMLLLLKRLGKGCNRTDNCFKCSKWFISLARNAIVVIIGIIIAYILNVILDSEPIALIGDMGSGLPKFEPPPFNTVVGNETYTFSDVIEVLGPQCVVIALIAILESVAIAKAFAGGAQIDATQEMIALGLCNILGSFVKSMPITGSFTRTALNHMSGVKTQAGGIFTGILIILALTLLTTTFYYIPKPTLAGVIITAMFSMIDYAIIRRLWKSSKRELAVLLFTMIISLSVGLEYGIISGILVEAMLLLFTTARPLLNIDTISNKKGKMIMIPLVGNISYCAADHVRRAVLRAAHYGNIDYLIVIDGTDLRNMDTSVASNLIAVVKDLEKNSHKIIFMNFPSSLQNMCTDINPTIVNKFVIASTTEDLSDRLKF